MAAAGTGDYGFQDHADFLRYSDTAAQYEKINEESIEPFPATARLIF
jgi:hypothetical protein